jgi:DNA-nicking Smr family endonuclease
MTRSRRDLTPDDLKLWRHVTRNVNPLRDLMPRHPTEDQASDDPPHPRGPAAPVLAPLPIAKPPRPVQPPLALGVTVDMDRRTARRFKRGEMAVDGRIDLHGLTLDQAHGALTAFLRGAYGRGSRCVVVVTGKGKGQSVGKIRSEAPHWLNQPPLRAMVLAVTQARMGDGGTGALYVLLKRKRA